MATPATPADRWVALLDDIATRYPLRERTAERVCLHWPAVADREAQGVQVEYLFKQNLSRVAVTADICAVERASPSEALALAAKLILGAVIARDGFVSLRHVFSEGRMVDSDVHEGILFLRDTAIEFRKQLLKWDSSAAPNPFFGG